MISADLVDDLVLLQIQNIIRRTNPRIQKWKLNFVNLQI